MDEEKDMGHPGAVRSTEKATPKSAATEGSVAEWRTPGPWVAEPSGVVGFGAPVIATGPGSHVAWLTRGQRGDGWPNAHLIAAAPDLYEAAELLAALGDVVADAYTDHGGNDRLRMSDGTLLEGEAAAALLALCRCIVGAAEVAVAALAKARGNSEARNAAEGAPPPDVATALGGTK